MKSFDEFLVESVFRYTWTAVVPEDVAQYVKVNKLKLMKDLQHPEFQLGLRSGNKLVFRYDPEEYTLYSDYTIIQLEDGKAK